MHLPSGIRHVVLVTFKCPQFARDMHHWLKSYRVADDYLRTMAQTPDAPSPPVLLSQKSMKMRHTYVMRRQEGSLDAFVSNDKTLAYFLALFPALFACLKSGISAIAENSSIDCDWYEDLKGLDLYFSGRQSDRLPLVALNDF